ncbi:DnaJ subfamily C member 7 [Blattella germanica]|nr:DnaJ subfamily C member 7 [Blattella germanica]
MMLHLYKEALEDARKSVALDNTFVKGYIRIAKCSLALGDLTAADNAISTVKELSPDNTTILPEILKLDVVRRFEEEGTKAYQKQDYRKVVFCMDRILEQVPCTRFKIKKAECLAFLGRYQEAQEIANDILHVDKQNADAVYVRGMCLYYQDNVDRAFSHFQHVLKLAPDHQKAMDIYKLGRLNEAVVDCSNALELDETYLKALLRRAKCYMDLNDFEEAVRDYEKALKMDKSRENKRLLQEAKLALKKSKRKDYYKILGVDKNASTDEIKKAYRKRALVHHPDRHANASDGEKKEQEKKFKEVGEAYGILSDPKKRARYDNGQDLEDMEGMASDIDPNNVFQAFFSEPGGGGQFNFAGGSFPGGFTFQFG